MTKVNSQGRISIRSTAVPNFLDPPLKEDKNVVLYKCILTIEGLSAQTCLVQILSFEKISFEVSIPNFALNGIIYLSNCIIF